MTWFQISCILQILHLLPDLDVGKVAEVAGEKKEPKPPNPTMLWENATGYRE